MKRFRNFTQQEKDKFYKGNLPDWYLMCDFCLKKAVFMNKFMRFVCEEHKNKDYDQS